VCRSGRSFLILLSGGAGVGFVVDFGGGAGGGVGHDAASIIPDASSQDWYVITATPRLGVTAASLRQLR
jgi:hypothetical protein